MDAVRAEPAPPVRAGHQRARGAVHAVFAPVLAGRAEPPTRIRRLHQAGSLKLRFPRRADGLSEAVLVNTAGGLAGGDQLEQRLEVEAGGGLRVTTQAAERVYRSGDGVSARLATRLVAGPGASLFFLPQETILFQGCRIERRLEVDCAPDAALLLCESVVLGRAASGERVTHGLLVDNWRVRCGGRLVFAETLRLGEDWDLVRSRAALGEARAFATVLARRLDADLAHLRALAGPLGGAGVVDGSLVVRLLAEDGYALRRRLVPLLAALSPTGIPGLWSL